MKKVYLHAIEILRLYMRRYHINLDSNKTIGDTAGSVDQTHNETDANK